MALPELRSRQFAQYIALRMHAAAVSVFPWADVLGMSLMTGENVSPRLLEALGLPKHTLWFELRVEAGKLATVKCAYHPEDGTGRLALNSTGDALADVILTEYELVERKP